MSDIPSVNYRFSDCYYATEFITPTSYDIVEAAKSLPDVKAVSEFIRDKFAYPLDSNSNPTASGQLLRYQKTLFNVWIKACRYYVWGFPSETLSVTKLGYCAETGTLATSLLIAKGIDAWSAIGEVRKSTDDTIIGYHLWTQFPQNGDDMVLETTIHTEGANNLIQCKSAYDKNSDWAKQGGLYYVKKGWFNHKEFYGDADLVTTLHLPAKRVVLFGREATIRVSKKKLYKEWAKEDAQKENLLKLAYRGGRK